jgi:integrase
MPRRAQLRLTDRAIKNLPVPATGARKYRFLDVVGLTVQITSAGSRSGGLTYRSPKVAAERLYTIGRWPTWSAVRLIAEAARLRRLVDTGLDPFEERERIRRARVQEHEAPTFADLAARYLDEHAPGKAPEAAADDRAMIRDYVLPALGKLRVVDVVKVDIARIHRSLTKAGKPVRANRCLAVMRTMFNLAIEWQMRLDNPAKGGRGGIKMNPENHCERFLSLEEIARLVAVLDRMPERHVAALVKFLLLTGCRVGEALRAEWAEFDLAAGLWVKPAARVKSRKQHKVVLGAETLALLRALKAAADNRYVFPAPETGLPMTTIKNQWRRIRREAGIEDVRIHDLRHSHASLLIGGGASLKLVQAQLGHADVRTTARYAHIADAAQREAMDRVGAAVTGTSAAVAELPRSPSMTPLDVTRSALQ